MWLRMSTPRTGSPPISIARSTRRPVALICTSGTAAANWFPAVIEARESRVPLLLLSADRPPEMRECSSGQTIDQLKLFGQYPRWQMELPVPEADAALFPFLRQTVIHAWERCLRFGRGPVHLNLPFRDPLAPVEDGSLAGLDQAAVWKTLDGVREMGGQPASAGPWLEERARELAGVKRGVIVAGNECWADGGEYARSAGALARALGWPVLADGLGPLREHAEAVPYLVHNYEWICGSGRAPPSPEWIVRLGPPPTGKRLRAWLEQTDCPHWLVDDGDRNVDPLHAAGEPLRCDAVSLARAVERVLPARRETDPGESAWTKTWLDAAALGRDRVNAILDGCGFFFEGEISRALSRHLPERTPVFVANSMPARDVEWFWEPGSRRREIFFNRGANGIDGTLSTAAGIARGSARPAVLLTGDLAFLHDANGLLHASSSSFSLTVVLINNGGGGIFEHLPIAAFDPPFERFFATPQRVDFGKLARAHGIPHQKVTDPAAFRRLISELPKSGTRVLEIHTDRKRDAAFRRELAKA